MRQVYDGAFRKLTDLMRSVPASVVALMLMMMAIPPNFPYGASRRHRTIKQVFSKEALYKIDFLGFALLLLSSLLLITGFEQAATNLRWKSASVIVPLVISGALWVSFFGWSWTLNRGGHAQEPVFTWRFVQNRELLGLLL